MTQRTRLLALAASLRLQADALEAEAEMLPKSDSTPELLDLAALRDRYGIGRDALLAAVSRKEIEVSRGPRNKLLVTDEAIRGWLQSRRVSPRSPLPPDEQDGEDALEAALESGELVAGGQR